MPGALIRRARKDIGFFSGFVKYSIFSTVIILIIKNLNIIARGSRTEGMVTKHLMPLSLSRNEQRTKDVEFLALTPRFL